MSDSFHNSAANARLPWALAGCELTAFAFLYLAGIRFIGLPVMGVLLLATYATRWRLSEGWLARWGFRTGIFATIILVVGRPRENTEVWYLIPEYLVRIGFLLCGEVIARVWQSANPSGKSGGALLMLSALIMAIASNESTRSMMQVFSPIYMFFAAISLASIGAAPRQRMDSNLGTKRAPTLLALRAVVFVLSLSMGFVAAAVLSKYYTALDTWAVELLQPKGAPSTVSIGFSQAPHLEAVFNPEPSTERLCLIEGPPGERHLRMLAFDGYAHAHWLPVPSQRAYTPVQPKDLIGGGSGQHLRITQLADTANLLAIPSEATRIESASSLERDELGSLRDRETENQITFDAVVRPTPFDAVPMCNAPDNEARARLLSIPIEIDPQVLTLARNVAGDGDAITKIFRLSKCLRSTHSYSLTYNPVGEPLNDFILHNRAAHCQYFASAMTVMARAAGIPARMVTGFYAHEPYGNGVTVVRQRDAHAWTECWIEGQGWITVDATPPGGRPDGLFPKPPKWKQWRERAADVPGHVRQWLSQLSRATLLKLLAAAAGVVGLVKVVQAGWNYRNQNRDQVNYRPAQADLAALSRRFDRWLNQQGITVAPHRTWREHLATLPGCDSSLWRHPAPSPLYSGERAGVRGNASSCAASQNGPSPQPSPPSTGEREQKSSAAMKSYTPVSEDATAGWGQTCMQFIAEYEQARFGHAGADGLPGLRKLLDRLEKSHRRSAGTRAPLQQEHRE